MGSRLDCEVHCHTSCKIYVFFSLDAKTGPLSSENKTLASLRNIRLPSLPPQFWHSGLSFPNSSTICEARETLLALSNTKGHKDKGTLVLSFGKSNFPLLAWFTSKACCSLGEYKAESTRQWRFKEVGGASGAPSHS